MTQFLTGHLENNQLVLFHRSLSDCSLLVHVGKNNQNNSLPHYLNPKINISAKILFKYFEIG